MTTVVLVQQGGTGANNAADARGALGAAPSAAYDQANSAFAQANLAYTAANTGGSSAGAAYDQANAAYGQANSAFAAANNRVLKTGDTMTGQLNVSSGGLIVQSNDSDRAAFIRSPSRTLRITPYYNSEGNDKGTWLEAINTANATYNKLTLSASNIIFEAAKVGINVGTPSSPLDVKANDVTGLGITLRAMADEYAPIQFLNSSGATTIGELAVNYSSESVYLASKTSIPVVIKTNDIDRVYVSANGNVGIGNTNPQRQLVVAGTVESTSGGYRFPDGTTQTTAATGAPTQNLVSGTTVTAIKDNHYILTNASATTVTLPAAPASGDIVWVTVVNGRVDNIIARNGKLLQGLSEDMTLDNQYFSGQLRFINDTYGWRLI